MILYDQAWLPEPIMLLVLPIIIPEFPIFFTHSYFISTPSPIIPVLFLNIFIVSVIMISTIHLAD